jgi:hypothetical protein
MSSGGGSMFPLCERIEVTGSSYSVSIALSSLDLSSGSRVLIFEAVSYGIGRVCQRCIYMMIRVVRKLYLNP